MSRFATAVNLMLAKLFPEKQLYLKAEDKTRMIRVTPAKQAMLTTALVTATGWTCFATANFAIDTLRPTDPDAQERVLKQAYEARIDQLTAERDQRALEASSAQTRFRTALGELSNQQDDILNEVTARQEIEAAMATLRGHLTEAIAERDAANTRIQELETQHANTEIGAAQDVEETLTTISAALTDTVTRRDQAVARMTELERKLTKLEAKTEERDEAQAALLSQLEEAVDVALSPLETVFSDSNINVESLLSDIRRDYSGSGGPFIDAGVSSKTFATDEQAMRFDKVMNDMDRISMLQVAGKRIPFAMPVKAAHRFTSGYGVRRDPMNRRLRRHNGIDFAAPLNTPIYATADGVVTYAGWQSGFGKVVKIRHAYGYESLYAHQNALLVKTGDQVAMGQQIGKMGTTGRSTGVHLHYEVRVNGSLINPMNYIKAAQNVLQK
ncbi:DUF5930 domain-containing protein [Paracoccaceae bacterium GXU_MW_L88]